MFHHKVDEVGPKDLPVARLNNFPQNTIGGLQSTKVPTAKRNNLLDSIQALEQVELFLEPGHINLERARGDVGKGKVNVRVFLGVNLV